MMSSRTTGIALGLLLVIVASVMCSFLWNTTSTQGPGNPASLYIYNWAEYIPADVLQDFEKETGITVIYDSFDSVEALETKIFTNPGYDVVFPPAWPLFVRCVQADLLVPLDYGLLPNAALLDPALMEKLRKADPNGAYGIPYLWGTTGIGVNEDDLRECLKNAPHEVDQDSWALLFDEPTARVLAPLKIFLLDAALDVFQAAMLYLGNDPTTEDIHLWDQAIAVVHKVRPHIRAFTSSRQKEHLLEGKSNLLQGFSTYITMAALQGTKRPDAGPAHKNLEKRIRYRLPKEGAMVWFDMMAIPKGARHIKNAHAFINFILRPDIMARISNAVCAANPVPASYPQLTRELLACETVFLSPELQQRLYPDFVPSAQLLKYLSRAWLKIKMGYTS